MATDPHCRVGKISIKAGAVLPALNQSMLATGISHPAALPEYDAGAGHGRRQSAWLTSSGGVNSSVIAHAATLRNRARDQIRKNPWARQIISRFVSNAIGTGIKPKSTHPDEPVRELLHESWRDWIDEADPEGVGNFYELQVLAVRGIFESGEVFIRRRLRPMGDGLTVPLQLQILEADHVPLTENRSAPGGNTVLAGIEYDREGRRVAYHIYREHPGEFMVQRTRSWELERVPASEILHIFSRERPGQVRGTPRLASVLVRLYQIDAYEDAELLRKKIAAMFSGFVSPGVRDDGTPLVDDRTPDKDGAGEITLEPGGMQVLKPGASITFSEPSEVGTSYDPFMKWNLRGAAAGAGVTYEQVTGDLSDVNFSSIRAGLLEFRRGIEQFQTNTPIYQMNRPTWNIWLEQAALAGVIDVADYAARKRTYMRCSWIPQGWEWVDPEKEQRAHLRAVRAGFKSRADVVSERGDNIEEVDRQLAADQKRARALGLTLDSDPSAVSVTGTTQARPEGSETNFPAETEGEGEGDGDGKKEKT